MYPILFQYKIISIGGYGVMLGLGFYLAFLLFERELILKKMDPELAYRVLLVAIPGGIVGSKIFHILEHLDEFAADPSGMIFSGAGLSAYGGFVLSFLLAYWITKRSGESFLRVGDAAAAPMALGYCFGRFGCHVAGDGCYGIESSSIFATAYPNGIVPSTVPVLPTPLFEVLFSVMVLGLMLQLRKKGMPEGRLFFLYLLLNGIPRFLVEFVRLNPKIFLGFTQAQVIGLLFIAGGIAGWVYTGRRKAVAQ
jgi:phosphatidylglycerol---prolipoprotein diacylglyceryl transferase